MTFKLFSSLAFLNVIARASFKTMRMHACVYHVYSGLPPKQWLEWWQDTWKFLKCWLLSKVVLVGSLVWKVFREDWFGVVLVQYWHYFLFTQSSSIVIFDMKNKGRKKVENTPAYRGLSLARDWKRCCLVNVRLRWSDQCLLYQYDAAVLH